MPVAAAERDTPAWTDPAATAALDPELARALRAEAAAQATAEGETVGIDFDPFLGGQDACARYEVAPAQPSGAGLAVAVHGVCDGERHAEPDAVVEVVRAPGGWRVVNVRYPSTRAELRALLDQARRARACDGREHPTCRPT